MKPDVALRWAEALESGEYEQTSGVLGVELPGGTRKYCCLGVLCELAINDGVPLTVTRSNMGFLRFDRNGGTLPERVREWADLGTDDMVRIGDNSAIGMNGGLVMSFPEIAREIRTHLVGVS